MSTKKSIIYISLGLLILTISIPLIIHANIGSDPLAAFVSSLAILTGLTYGTMLPTVNVLFLIVHFIKYRDIKFCLIGISMSILMGIIINLINANILIHVANTNLLIQILLFGIGFILMAIGIAMIQFGKIQKLPFEGFQLAIADTVKKDINLIRVFVEVGLAILAIILLVVLRFVLNNGVVITNFINFGTIFIMLSTGPAINFVYKKILKGE